MLVWLVALAGIAPATAQTLGTDRALAPETARSIDGLARQAVHERRTPGLAIDVIEDGRVVYARGFGVASLATHRPFLTDTESFAGPLTMQFTAAATLLLAQSGKLKLDDRVVRYVPELAHVAETVTVGQLLAQTSGLPPVESLASVSTDPTRSIKTADLLAALDKAKPSAAPGSAYANNPLNYIVAGIVVERAGGETLSDYLQQQIFAPLVMERTFLAGDTGISNARAAGYAKAASKSGFAAVRPWDPAWMLGARGLVTTADDLAKWDIEMPVLLRDEAMRATFAPVDPNASQQVGLGWILDRRGGHRYFWYGGGVAGYDAANALLPDDRVAVIVLANVGSSGDPGGGFAARIARRVLDLVVPVQTGRLDNAVVERAKEWLARLASKRIDRTQLTPGFSTYLSDDFVERQHIDALGKIEAFVPLSSTMQSNGDTLYVFWVRFDRAQYRYEFAVTPAGKIDEIQLVA